MALRRMTTTASQLPQDAVHVWPLTVPGDPDTLATFRAVLTGDELARADRFVFARDRHNFSAARGALRMVLGFYLGITPQAVVLHYGRHGKPDLAKEFGLRFNLSHAGNWVYLAFTSACEVGIDVERLRAPGRHSRLDLARRFFSVDEVTHLAALSEARQLEAFFACWTRKEAYIKLHGRGLTLPLAQFAVSVDPDQPARLANAPRRRGPGVHSRGRGVRVCLRTRTRTHARPTFGQPSRCRKLGRGRVRRPAPPVCAARGSAFRRHGVRGR